MPSSPLPVSNSPTLSTKQLPVVPVLVPSIDVPTTSPPPINPTTVTEAKDVGPDNDVPPVPITSAQPAEPIDSASAAIVNVPEPVPAEAPKPQLTPGVLVPTESIPAVKSATVDLTDDQDDVAPHVAVVKPADDTLDTSSHPMGM